MNKFEDRWRRKLEEKKEKARIERIETTNFNRIAYEKTNEYKKQQIKDLLGFGPVCINCGKNDTITDEIRYCNDCMSVFVDKLIEANYNACGLKLYNQMRIKK